MYTCICRDVFSSPSLAICLFFLNLGFKLRLKQLHDDGMLPKFMCIVPRLGG
jgi:hypothetical protein